jgi:hypothetical protein
MMETNHLVCLHEKDWGEVTITMLNVRESLNRIENKMCKHIDEGERPGGVRDRVNRIEWEVSEFKKRFWWSSIMGGLIGALIGSGSSDVIRIFINWFISH